MTTTQHTARLSGSFGFGELIDDGQQVLLVVNGVTYTATDRVPCGGIEEAWDEIAADAVSRATLAAPPATAADGELCVDAFGGEFRKPSSESLEAWRAAKRAAESLRDRFCD